MVTKGKFEGAWFESGKATVHGVHNWNILTPKERCSLCTSSFLW